MSCGSVSISVAVRAVTAVLVTLCNVWWPYEVPIVTKGRNMPAETPPTAPESLPKYLREVSPKQEVGPLADAHEYIDELIEWKQRPVERRPARGGRAG